MQRVARLACLGLLLALAAPPAAARAAVPLDPHDLEIFFEGLLAGLMPARRVPGAVVLVVLDGRVLFEKGYGVANLGTGAPIDPETTLFRVASNSKLITTTAVMQLVEQGKLDLDADVNTYLVDFQVPPAFGQPITLRNLLTHTAGFDDAFLDTIRPLGTPPEPLAHALRELLPRRVEPPGQAINYSNRGVALAAHLVERASGQGFDDYVRAHVLVPLGMTKSGFHLPDPPPPELATGYDWRGERYVPSRLDEMRIWPAGAFYTSAGEMSRFMRAHLALGRIRTSLGGSASPEAGEARLLREDTAREMQRSQFRHHPALAGWCLGFEENVFDGTRVIGHGGSWAGYGTRLLLVPEAKLGLFVSTTRSYDPRFFDPLLDAFFARFFPPETPRITPTPPAELVAHAGEYAGTYIPLRRMRHEFLKLGLLLAESSVRAQTDGSLVLRLPAESRDPLRLVPLTPDLFAVDGSDERVHFRRDGAGRVDQLRLDQFAADRVAWPNHPGFHRLALLLCTLLFVGTVLGYPLGTLVRRVAGGPASGVPVAARVVAFGVSLLELGLLAGLGASLATIDPFSIMGGVPGWMRALFAVPLLAIPLSLAIPVYFMRSFRSRGWAPLQRLHFAALSVAVVVFAVECWYWNLIGIPA